MKYRMVVFIVSILVWAWGCEEQTQEDKQSHKQTQGNHLSGTWQGTVTEKGKSTLVELSLQEKKSKIEGKLTVLSETGQDIDKGMSFTLIEVERTENHLKFIVPIGGEDEEDNVVFDLRIAGNRLEGIGHEMREGSEKLPITFTKK